MDLIVLLSQARRPVGFTEIAQQFGDYQGKSVEAAKRMFERDKQLMVEMGIPLHCEKKTEWNDLDEDGYLIDRKRFLLPDIDLSPEERAALAVTAAVGRHHAGLSDAAELDDALRKLAFASPPPVETASDEPRRAPSDTPPLALHFPNLQVSEHMRAHASVLEEAARGRKQVTLRYRAESSATETERKVDPYGCFYRRGYWYLVGRCHHRDAVRLFRFDRILSVEAASGPRHPDFEPPADFDLGRYSQLSPWSFELGRATDVVLEVDRELASVVEEDFGPDAQRIAATRGATRVRFRCGNLAYLVTRVLAAAGRMRVVEPEAVRLRIHEAAGAVAAAYGTVP